MVLILNLNFRIYLKTSTAKQSTLVHGSAGTGTPTGAATFTFIQAIERHGGNISYGQLLVDMNEILNPGGDGYGR